MAMMKQPPQKTADELARELSNVRVQCEALRMKVKTVSGRVSAMYVQVDELKKRENGR